MSDKNNALQDTSTSKADETKLALYSTGLGNVPTFGSSGYPGLYTQYFPTNPLLYDSGGFFGDDRYSSAFDFSSGFRRKNATKETTSALKAWLHEHKKNPYPTKGEKIMLAILTRMTVTQVMLTLTYRCG